MYRLKLLNRPLVYSIIFSLIVVIPICLDFFPTLTIIQKIGIILFFAIVNFIFAYYDITRYTLKINLDNIPELMVKSLFGNNHNYYRSNIMFYNKKKRQLEIYHSFNMMGALDRNLKINIDKQSDLCASNSFSRMALVTMDVNQVHTHTRLVSQNKIPNSMSSVISTPILNKKGTKAIGALNIDSNLPLNQSGFQDENIYIVLNAYSDIISDTVG